MSSSKMQKPNTFLNVAFILSFIWISIFPVCSQITDGFDYNFGNLFDTGSEIFGRAVVYIIISALASWLVIELVFMLYRFILSFKIYSFILPEENLKREFKSYFIYRNIYLGIFLNLCFLFPCIYVFSDLINILITTITFALMANNIRKVYSQPIVSHFVFNCFIRPVIFYEVIIVAIDFVQVVL